MSDRCDALGPKHIVDGQHHHEGLVLCIESRNSRQCQEPINGAYVLMIATHHFHDVLVEQDQFLGICLAGYGQKGLPAINTCQCV